MERPGVFAEALAESARYQQYLHRSRGRGALQLSRSGLVVEAMQPEIAAHRRPVTLRLLLERVAEESPKSCPAVDNPARRAGRQVRRWSAPKLFSGRHRYAPGQRKVCCKAECE
jgi:hypothetical protein